MYESLRHNYSKLTNLQRRQVCFIFLIFVAAILFFFFNFESEEESTLVLNRCIWKQNGPVLMNLKTHLNVYYDGGQWFHMSENFLVQHSMLKKNRALLNATDVYYNFDSKNFKTNLNPFTRFIIYLGTQSLSSPVQTFHFLENLPLKSHHIRQNEAIIIDHLAMANAQVLSLSSNISSVRRFKDEGSYSSHLHNACVKYVGFAGGKRLERGLWFNQSSDVPEIRQKIRRACPRDPSLINEFKRKRKYKLVIYQRDQTRTLLNANESLTMIRSQLPSPELWDTSIIIHSNDYSPCDLAHMFYDVDVLVTPHGFQSMLMLFLPIPAILFEVFPSLYYKGVYHMVGAEYGIMHGHSVSVSTTWHHGIVNSLIGPDLCLSFVLCRMYGRDQHVILSSHGVKQLIDLIHTNLGLFNDTPIYPEVRYHKNVKSYRPLTRDSLYALPNPNWHIQTKPEKPINKKKKKSKSSKRFF